MRWLLAGLCFAIVVGLAVATTAIKASNVAARARLYALQRRIEGHSIEQARRALVAREGTAAADLARRWRRLAGHRDYE